MTHDEAIKAINSNMPTKGTYIILAEALGLAIEALEKQIAKKPIYGGSTYRTEDNYLGREITCGECSEQICYEHSVIEHFKFCNECGTKIDWGKE